MRGTERTPQAGLYSFEGTRREAGTINATWALVTTIWVMRWGRGEREGGGRRGSNRGMDECDESRKVNFDDFKESGAMEEPRPWKARWGNDECESPWNRWKYRWLDTPVKICRILASFANFVSLISSTRFREHFYPLPSAARVNNATLATVLLRNIFHLPPGPRKTSIHTYMFIIRFGKYYKR